MYSRMGSDTHRRGKSLVCNKYDPLGARTWGSGVLGWDDQEKDPKSVSDWHNPFMHQNCLTQESTMRITVAASHLIFIIITLGISGTRQKAYNRSCDTPQRGRRGREKTHTREWGGS